jgi:hypothetical protein
MRAVLCDRFEGIGALRTGETAEPIPAADEILIDVHAASASFKDYLMASGGYQMRRVDEAPAGLADEPKRFERGQQRNQPVFSNTSDRCERRGRGGALRNMGERT